LGFLVRQSFRQEALAKIARRHAAGYLVPVIKAIDAAQGGPPQESAGCSLFTGHESADGPVADQVSPKASDSYEGAVTPSDTPLLTLEEKRRILARIVRVNSLDCLDDSGAFDIVRARRVLPPGAVRHIDIDETTRMDAEGQPVTQRRIRLRLVDPLSVLRLDDILERRQHPAPPSASSKMSERKTFNLLREKTMALDDALQSIEELKKSLAEADDRELQLHRELEEKDRHLETSKSLSLPNLPARPGQSSSQAPGRVAEAHSPSWEPGSEKPNVQRSPEEVLAKGPGNAHGRALDKVPYHELPRRKREIEDARNSMGSGAFSEWLAATSIEPPGFRLGAPRPPPEYGPMSVMNQGRCRMVE
jgi:hypothetical protein